MTEEVDLDELRSLAVRLDPAAEVEEQLSESDANPSWMLRIDIQGAEPVEVRSRDRSRARRTIKTTLIELLGERGLLREPDLDRIDFSDPHADNRSAYSDLVSVLETAHAEEDIQKCIERHPEIWRYLLTSTKPQVIPKMPLGHNFVTDFVVFGAAPWSQSQRPTATFIEIERADAPLFNAKGDPSAALTHGQRQLRNWRQWIRDNKQQVRDYMLDKTYLSWERHGYEGQPAGMPSFGFEDHYLLIIGRRATLSPPQRWQLHQICEEFPKTITYDVLLEMLCPEAPYRLPWLQYD